MKMDVNRIYELRPKDGRKSFYGKAIVETKQNGDEVLYSYLTPILIRKRSGELVRVYNDWSATTGRHIAAFCGLGKKDFMSIPYKSIR